MPQQQHLQQQGQGQGQQALSALQQQGQGQQALCMPQQQHLQPQLQSYLQGLPQLFLKFLSQQSMQQQSFLHQNPPKHFQKTLSGWHQLQAVAKIMPRTKH